MHYLCGQINTTQMYTMQMMSLSCEEPRAYLINIKFSLGYRIDCHVNSLFSAKRRSFSTNKETLCFFMRRLSLFFFKTKTLRDWMCLVFLRQQQKAIQYHSKIHKGKSKQLQRKRKTLFYNVKQITKTFSHLVSIFINQVLLSHNSQK